MRNAKTMLHAAEAAWGPVWQHATKSRFAIGMCNHSGGICAKYDGQNKCLCTVIQECLLEYLFLYMLLVLHICAHACGMQAFMEHSSTKVLLPASKKDNGCRKQERRRCRVGLKRSSGCLAESWKRLGNLSKEVPKSNRSLVLDLISDRLTTTGILP